ncbi:hypothetical protein CDL12_30011 [Handroanthus impetiginosus]|uniref:Aminotransferase class I/classII large domain-containing protein n=1 Tax=Handroanthus impetiginosus TaxID=429701 RepID=A0A2G9FWU2_9LAMI|nr:hypothetical protein CDL12_30011 [Handroanthus impetiginosus]
MENKLAKWGFNNQKESNVAIRDTLETLKRNLNKNDERPLIHLGHGDPSAYPSFRTTPVAEEALVNSLRSAQFNGYAPAAGISEARRAIAEYLSDDLPYKLSEEDIFLTAGANHAIEVALTVLACPGANILLPRPGYPLYEARAAFSNLEVRHFDLLPEKGWEVDLDAVEALADDNTIAIVVINPGNPCGNVFTYEHMQKIVKCIETYRNITADAPTLIQGAVPEILEKSTKVFFLKTNALLREAADTCYGKLNGIPALVCPLKPEGAMATMVKINLELLEDVKDDMDFSLKLANEESVLVLPGSVLGLRNWVRLSYAVELATLEDGLERIKAFCLRQSANK